MMTPVFDHPDLLPCFCGCIPEMVQGVGYSFSIRCRNSKCFGPMTPSFGSKKEAAEAWNRRPQVGARITSAELANEIFEFLFGKLEGHIPRKLSDPMLTKLADHLLQTFKIMGEPPVSLGPDWILWAGGPMPVNPETMVYLMCAGHDKPFQWRKYPDRAGSCNWNYPKGDPLRIVGYKVHTDV